MKQNDFCELYDTSTWIINNNIYFKYVCKIILFEIIVKNLYFIDFFFWID